MQSGYAGGAGGLGGGGRVGGGGSGQPPGDMQGSPCQQAGRGQQPRGGATTGRGGAEGGPAHTKRWGGGSARVAQGRAGQATPSSLCSACVHVQPAWLSWKRDLAVSLSCRLICSFFFLTCPSVLRNPHWFWPPVLWGEGLSNFAKVFREPRAQPQGTGDTQWTRAQPSSARIFTPRPQTPKAPQGGCREQGR